MAGLSYFKSKYGRSGREIRLTVERQSYFRKFCDYFRLDGCIFEIGSGTGEFLAFCAVNGRPAIGIEPDKDSFEFSSEWIRSVSSPVSLFNLDFRAALAELDLSSVSCVVAFDVFEHIEFLDLVSALQNFRSLNPGPARIIFRVPNMDVFTSSVYWYGDYTHVCGFGYFKFVQLANLVGASCMITHRDFYPTSRLSHIVLSSARLVADAVIYSIYRIKGAPRQMHVSNNVFCELIWNE